MLGFIQAQDNVALAFNYRTSYVEAGVAYKIVCFDKKKSYRPILTINRNLILGLQKLADKIAGHPKSKHCSTRFVIRINLVVAALTLRISSELLKYKNKKLTAK